MSHIISALQRLSALRSAFWRESSHGRRHSRSKGFTIFELLIVVAIMATLASIAIYSYTKLIERTRNVKAISDIKNLESMLENFNLENERYPDSIDELGKGTFRDPWGNPYQYVNIATAPSQEWRRDRNNKPINTYYDLWSNGPDGDSQKQVNAAKSRDDIIRAWDGSFIGVADDFDELWTNGQGQGGGQGQGQGQGGGQGGG